MIRTFRKSCCKPLWKEGWLLADLQEEPPPRDPPTLPSPFRVVFFETWNECSWIHSPHSNHFLKDELDLVEFILPTLINCGCSIFRKQRDLFLNLLCNPFSSLFKTFSEGTLLAQYTAPYALPSASVSHVAKLSLMHSRSRNKFIELLWSEGCRCAISVINCRTPHVSDRYWGFQ